MIMTVGRSTLFCGTVVVVPAVSPGTTRVVTGILVMTIMSVPLVPETVVVPALLPAV